MFFKKDPKDPKYREKYLLKFLNENQLELPNDYIDYLINPPDLLDEELKKWGYWNIAGIFKEDPSNGKLLEDDFGLGGIPGVPFYKAINQFLVAKQDDFQKPETKSIDGEKFSFERLRKSFCIGEEENGLDMLFIDIDTKAIYAFYHDDFRVEKMGDSFTESLKYPRK